jgi:hypothetical protein
MIGGLPLGFAEPLVLIGLLTLPVLWWLLRLIPPRPRRIDFPPTRLLLEIAPKEETPARTPWWLTLMRLALAALVIIAAAGPLWNPPVAAMKTRAPIAILIDDGWTAAAAWDARLRTADDVIARAENDRRAVALIPLSEGIRDISFATAASARVRLHQIKPAPHTVDRTEALPAIARFLADTHDVELVWLSDDIDLGRGADFVKAFAPMLDNRAMTIVSGGIAPARGADRRRQRGWRAERQGVARLRRRGRHRHGARARPQGPAARRSGVCFQARGSRNRGAVRPSGRNPQ